MPKKKQRRRKSEAQYSSLASHKKAGKSFLPPMLSLPTPLKLQSWLNDRLPEMLWAALLLTHLGRAKGLEVFRRVAYYGGDKLRNFDKPLDVRLTDMAAWPNDWRRELLGILTTGAEPKRALRPLLLFEDLPAKADWREAIAVEPVPEKDWLSLAKAVASTLDHQSQEATDCRWARLVFQVTLGRVHFHSSMREQAEEILFYPDRGDQRAVRPSIRSAELGLETGQDNSMPRVWPNKFWAQCLRDTGCRPISPGSEPEEDSITPEYIRDLYEAVRSWSERTRSTTAVDPRHEAIVGAALFAIGVLAEIKFLRAERSILGRFGLRTLLEVQVTLAYLLKAEDMELWRSYRVFGAGQAKLQFLHLERLGGAPTFVDINILESLANEDQWQEFLKIEVGHWAKLSLRDLSIKTDLKDDYDMIYPWTSTYVHGHWGAIRDSVFGVCLNPLHRLHRVPLGVPRLLDPVLKEATELVEKIVRLAQTGFPDEPIFLGLQEEE
ncbi:MAG: DUF5677 domain-containing protein [Thermoanaerobaculia bacterium]